MTMIQSNDTPITQDMVINLDDILAVTSQLAHLLAQETLLMKQFKITGVAALQEEKLKHLIYLEATDKLLKTNPAIVHTLPQQKIRELAAISGMLTEVMEENHQELLKARATNKKVLEIMTSIIIDKVKEKSGYNRTGKMGNYLGKAGTIPALAINNSI